MCKQPSPIEDEEADESWWSHILLTLVTDTTASPFHVLTNQAEKKKKKKWKETSWNMKNGKIILLRSVAIQILYAGSSPVPKQLKPSAAFREALASSPPRFLGGGCFCPCFVSWLSTDTGRYNGLACIWLFHLCLSVQSCRLRWFNVQMWVLLGLEKWDLRVIQ